MSLCIACANQRCQTLTLSKSLPALLWSAYRIVVVMTSFQRARRTTRFSLLLLEDSEVLLSDLAVQYHFIPDSTVGSPLHPLNSYPQRFVSRSTNTAVRGRIKLATHSILFDSDNWRDAVIRLPLVSVEYVRPTRDNFRSRGSDWSSQVVTTFADDIAEDDNSVMIFANAAVFQRELGVDHPYINVHLRGRHVFTPLYSSASTLLDDINSLLRITTLSPRLRSKRLRELVQEREARVSFDVTLLQYGLKEVAMMDAAASAVYPMSQQPGRFRITRLNLYFMPVHTESSSTVERISVTSIISLRSLFHGCRDAAIEVGYLVDVNLVPSENHATSTLMLAFPSCQVRQHALHLLHSVIQHPVQTYDRRELEAATSKWRRGDMSNFDYIMHLNLTAGRSFNDLSQYPVFPWVIQDYSSTSLDLSNPRTFRDLSRPIGALNEHRLRSFMERYHEMPPPRFIYGTHYSTPAYIIHYLVRAAPAAMLRLQNGRFDIPDRLFHSIAQAWDSVLHNRGDVKELIPEFYALDFSSGCFSGVVSRSASVGEFLDNVLGLDLGTRQDGIRLDDVELPPWANGSSELFVRKMKQALESEYASNHIHNWLDLIFGIKSRNADACNVFYTDVALPQSIGIEEEKVIEEDELLRIETVYLEFGRTPKQLFRYAHSPRFGDTEIVNMTSAAEGISVTYNSIALRAGDCGISSKDGSTSEAEPSPAPFARLRSRECNSGIEIPHRVRRVGSAPVHSGKASLNTSGKSRSMGLSIEKEKSTDLGLFRSMMIAHKDDTHEGDIVDMCVAEGDYLSLDSMLEHEAATVCTAWSSGYLKVYSGDRMVRSRFIDGLCSVTYTNNGLVAFGGRDGALGVYDIERGRVTVALESAHEADVLTLAFDTSAQVLVSGSLDGAVKVWKLPNSGRSTVDKLRLLQEADAENGVQDVCVTCVMCENLGFKNLHTESDLMVAAWTTDNNLLMWRMAGEGSHAFAELFWRWDGGCDEYQKIYGRVQDPGNHEENVAKRKRRIHVLAWITTTRQDVGRNGDVMLANTKDTSLRMWRVRGDGNVQVTVDISIADTCGIIRCLQIGYRSRSVLVTGDSGNVAEFDATGLCIMSARVASKGTSTVQLAFNSNQKLVVWDNNDNVYVVRLR